MCLQIPTVDFRLLCSLFPFSRDAVHLSVLFSLIVPHHVRLPPLRQGFIRPRSCWGVNCTRNDRSRSVWEWGRGGNKVYQALGLSFSRGCVHCACKACVDIFVVCCVSLLVCVFPQPRQEVPGPLAIDMMLLQWGLFAHDRAGA